MPTRKYFRLILGKANMYADECFRNNYIGIYGFNFDLTGKFTESWKEFNDTYIPVFQKENPGKSKIAGGLYCAGHWMVGCGIQIGDIVLSPNGKGNYLVGEITGPYEYKPELPLPHSRQIEWFPFVIEKAEFSQPLINSAGTSLTYCELTRYADEIQGILNAKQGDIYSKNPEIEDVSAFVLEKHLEDFLVENWKNTEFAAHYEILSEDGEMIGQQYQTDTGPIDILAISKDKKTLLVVELKKGKASDSVVGQIQRYMGYVKDVLLEKDQTVRGVIIALKDDLKMRRALSMTTNIEFYKYSINFKLEKA